MVWPTQGFRYKTQAGFAAKPTANESVSAGQNCYTLYSTPTSTSTSYTTILGSQQQTVDADRKTLVGEVYMLDQTRETVFGCRVEECVGITFGRLSDLRRHYYTKHDGSIMWCPARGCERSETVGKRPFPAVRLDNLRDHIVRAHGLSCLDGLNRA
jgi:hypothetical protein